MTTLKDIAERTSFSICTVSQVLNAHPKTKRMRKSTVETILRAAKELDYAPSMAAKALSTGHSGMLGLLIGCLDDSVFSCFQESFIRAAEERHQKVMTLITGWDEKKEVAGLRELRSRGCDGVFYMTSSLARDPELCSALVREKYPVITYAAPVQGLGSASVDYSTGFASLAASAASRGKTLFAFLPEDSVRVSVMRAEAEKAKCPFRNPGNPLVFGKEDFESVERTVRANPEGIFVFDTTCQALKALSFLMKKKISIPEKAELVGIGLERWAEYFLPALSTVTFDVSGMMEKVVDSLISGREISAFQMIFPTTYTKRDTSK